ncbi:MAG TPA: hypothetical protein VFY54_00040, partial [Rubrobacter sp.]|nr:hypothetical protein [Rubrobacter sp.]
RMGCNSPAPRPIIAGALTYLAYGRWKLSALPGKQASNVAERVRRASRRRARRTCAWRAPPWRTRMSSAAVGRHGRRGPPSRGRTADEADCAAVSNDDDVRAAPTAFGDTVGRARPSTDWTCAS